MYVEISDGDLALNSVLILEDEGMVAMLIEDLVKDLGATDVHVFSDVAPALDMARTHDFDCAILDVVLRDADSGAVADILAERGIPFLFSTGSGPDAVPALHRHRPLITKPFIDGDLQHLLLQVMSAERPQVSTDDLRVATN